MRRVPRVKASTAVPPTACRRVNTICSSETPFPRHGITPPPQGPGCPKKAHPKRTSFRDEKHPAQLAALLKPKKMRTAACQFFYDCTGCGALLRPKVGDCCVFCPSGSLPWPPVQKSGKLSCYGIVAPQEGTGARARQRTARRSTSAFLDCGPGREPGHGTIAGLSNSPTSEAT
jgi:hypothetical protein